MTVTFAGGFQRKNAGMWEDVAEPTVATSTTARALTASATNPDLNIRQDVIYFTGPTGSFANFYTLATGAEGQELWMVYGATGAGGGTSSARDIQVIPTSLYPQSSITFSHAGQYWHGKFMNEKWNTIDRTTLEIQQVTGTVTAATHGLATTVDEVHFDVGAGTATQGFYLPPGNFHGQRVIIDNYETGATMGALRCVATTFRAPVAALVFSSTGNGTPPAHLYWNSVNWSVVAPYNWTGTATIAWQTIVTS